ncbi:MAG: type II toxin-antitoxin system RelE/ParE family toxin [Sarcina sp.]
MYNIKFFKKQNGEIPVLDYMKNLEKKSVKSKNARVKRDKIEKSLDILKERGTSIGAPTIRHLEGNLYKIRVLDSRMFFFRDNEDFIMLSHFIKNTQKTPEKEKAIARKRSKAYLEFKEVVENDNN